MKTSITHLLGDKQGEDIIRLKFLKLGLLEEFISKQFYPRLYENYRNLKDQLAAKSAQDIVERGTCFFWKNIHHCYRQGACNDVNFKITCENVLRTGFDSYFDWFPIGFSMTFMALNNVKVMFPELGIQFVMAKGSFKITKVDGALIRITSKESELVIDLKNIDPNIRIKKFHIPKYPKAQLVLAKSSSIFDDDYIDRLYIETDQAEFLSKLIGKSIELIEAAMPELKERLYPFIKWYFPINSPNVLTHNSFSVNYMNGAIFLSIAYEDFRLAEAIVHELHHNELYRLQETHSLFEIQEEDIYYSPFRTDPRPLNGLLHAIFVFTGVADFLEKVELISQLADYHESIRFRREEVVRQVRLGIAQLNKNRLTETGLEIVSWIEETISRHESALGPLEGNLPKVMLRHLNKWCEDNPQLKHIIQIPENIQVAYS